MIFFFYFFNRDLLFVYIYCASSRLQFRNVSFSSRSNCSGVVDLSHFGLLQENLYKINQ